MATNTSLCVSIDVESDMPDWVVKPETTLENVKGIPRLQELLERYGVRPTYLLTYPVADSKECLDIFRPLFEEDRCEIGMHCHPWTTPPISEDERLVASYLSNLPDAVVQQKLAAVTDKITESFGERPVSYRAGRFGLAPAHLVILEELGFKVDSSITPLVDWTSLGGPDYRDAPLFPYRPNYLDVRKEGNSRLLEIPVTITLTRLVPDWVKWLYVRIPRFTKLRGLLSRDHLNMLDLVWAYAAEFSAEEMIIAGDMAERRGAPVVNFFMHSNEVWPGGSPYCKNEEDLDAYLERLGAALSMLVERRGFVPRTLKEFHEESAL